MGDRSYTKERYDSEHIVSHSLWARKKIEDYGLTQIRRQDLINYYESYNGQRENKWRNELGDDLNWINKATLNFIA